jgi:DNA-binding LacI/PurR family transcriptional regulator
VRAPPDYDHGVTQEPTPGDRPVQRSVTLRAVAQHAGVSKSLVSRVLQGSPHVSPERRRAVEDAIRELGYRPHGAARSLTRRRTQAVGVLVTDLAQPWFADFLAGLDRELHRSDLHAFVGDARLDRTRDEPVLRAFLEMRVDGLVLAGSMPISPMIEEAPAWLPTVVAGSRDLDLPRTDVVVQDDVAGVRLALEHLAELGHRRIAHLAGTGGRTFAIRRDAYLSWMAERGWGDDTSVEECAITEDGGYAGTHRLLARPGPRPTAVVAVNDPVCAGAVSAARELGIRTPEELSLVGFDNSQVARMRHLALTSVDVAAPEVGRLAARHLLERMDRPELPARARFVPPSLAVRQSTTAPPPD